MLICGFLSLDLALHLPSSQFAYSVRAFQLVAAACLCVLPALDFGFFSEPIGLQGLGLTWIFRRGAWTPCFATRVASDSCLSFCGFVVLILSEDMCVCRQMTNPFVGTPRTLLSHHIPRKPDEKWRGTDVQLLLFLAVALVFHVLKFDATLGFPGEGPTRLQTIVSMNLGSIMTNNIWQTFDCTALCAQETRIGRNNVKHAQKSADNGGKMLFPGNLLPGILQKNGKHRVAHGGTAVLAPPPNLHNRFAHRVI